MAATKNRRLRKDVSPSPPTRVSAGRGIGRSWACYGLLALVIFFALVFFTRPIPLFSSGVDTVSRGWLAIWPFLDPGAFTWIWGGNGERWGDFWQSRAIPITIVFLQLATALTIGSVILEVLRLFWRLRLGEAIFFSLVVGLAVWSALLPILVNFGWETRWSPEVCRSFFFVGYFGGMIVVFRIVIITAKRQFERKKTIHGEKATSFGSRLFRQLAAERFLPLLILAFVTIYLLGGLVPPYEYDALEYHTQGAREIAETGQIGFFSHNAYQNMPLGAEMAYLWGIWLAKLILHADSFGDPSVLLAGTVGGKTFLTTLAFLTAWGLSLFCRRFFPQSQATSPVSPSAASVAVVAPFVYLAFPENYQNFTNGLNDGVLGLASFATLYALLLLWSAREKKKEDAEENQAAEVKPLPRVGLVFLVGIFAGFAASVKYTGVVFVGIPATIAILFILIPSKATGRATLFVRKAPGERLLLLLTFFSGALIAGGFWYLKNACVTGNPVWPLGYYLFGDSTGTWSAAINTRWLTAHSSSDFSPSALLAALVNFGVSDSFAAPIFALFGWLAIFPVAKTFFRRFSVESDPATGTKILKETTVKNSPSVTAFLALIGFALFYVAVWEINTHRIVRFLVPLYPVLAILTAIGFVWLAARLKKRFARILLYAIFLFGGWASLTLDAATAGYILAPYDKAENDSNRYGVWSIWFNRQTLPLGKKLLLVGDARAFAYRVPLLYSTCWNRSPLVNSLPESFQARWREAVAAKTRTPDLTPEEAATLKVRLAENKVEFLLVDFGEIGRFLSPGNYGLTDGEFFRPELFDSIERAGIIEPLEPEEDEEFYKQSIPSVRVWRVKTE